MKTEICKRLGIEFPIFAFSHCRDVVAAVSNAGGFGVLGARRLLRRAAARSSSTGSTSTWPAATASTSSSPASTSAWARWTSRSSQAMLAAQIPAEHRAFAKKLLADHGVPELPTDEKPRELLGWTASHRGPAGRSRTRASQGARVRERARHAAGRGDQGDPGDRPPRSARSAAAPSRPCRTRRRASTSSSPRAPRAAATPARSAASCSGREVIEAAAPIPVLAAGGIGSGKQMAAAMALGAQGVWTGSIWLTVTEADTPPAQKESYLKATSRDTVRSRSWTGKPCRMLKNDWTEAWDKPENPKPLGMPLQFMVTAEAVSRGHHYAAKAQAVGFNPGRPDRRPHERDPLRTPRDRGHGAGLHRRNRSGSKASCRASQDTGSSASRHRSAARRTATVGKRERVEGRRRVLRSRSARTAHRRANGGSLRDRCVEGAHGTHQAVGASRTTLRDCAPDREIGTRRRPLHRPPPAAVIGRRTDVLCCASSASSELRRYGRAAEGSPAGPISVRSAHRKFVRAASVAR